MQDNEKVYFRESLGVKCTSTQIAESFLDGRIDEKEIFLLNGIHLTFPSIVVQDNIVQQIVLRAKGAELLFPKKREKYIFNSPASKYAFLGCSVGILLFSAFTCGYGYMSYVNSKKDEWQSNRLQELTEDISKKTENVEKWICDAEAKLTMLESSDKDSNAKRIIMEKQICTVERDQGKQKERLDSLDEKLSRIDDVTTSAKREIDAAGNQIAETIKKNKQTSAQLNAINEANKQAISGIRSELSVQNATIEQMLSTTREKASKDAEKIAKLEQSFTSVGEKTQKAETDIHSLKEQLGKANKKIDDLESKLTETDIHSLKEQLEKAYKKIGTLEDKLKDSRSVHKEKVKPSENHVWDLNAPLSLEIGEGVLLDMVPCFAGTFFMGSPEKETARDPDEKEHPVTIATSFLIGKYEVTQEQYSIVMGQKPSYWRESTHQPVENISWYEAMNFCSELNRQTEGKRPVGYHFSLPTEEQWEYACRAGSMTAFSQGDSMRSNEANFNNDKHGTLPVGSFSPPNEWGIYDMHGNVREWCLNDYHRDFEYVTGGSPVIRGGSYRSDLKQCRSAYRSSASPETKESDLGFRVVLTSSTSETKK